MATARWTNLIYNALGRRPGDQAEVPRRLGSECSALGEGLSVEGAEREDGAHQKDDESKDDAHKGPGFHHMLNGTSLSRVTAGGRPEPTFDRSRSE